MNTDPEVASTRPWSRDLGEHVRRAWMALSGRRRDSADKDDDDDDLPRPNAVVMLIPWRPLIPPRDSALPAA